MKQREYRILELLTERKRIEVAALAREIGVSQVTVRKDLDALEEKGFCFVTVEQLMARQGIAPEAGVIFPERP